MSSNINGTHKGYDYSIVQVGNTSSSYNWLVFTIDAKYAILSGNERDKGEAELAAITAINQHVKGLP